MTQHFVIDLKKIVLLAVISIIFAIGLNYLRKEPLSLSYQSSEQRVTSIRLQGNETNKKLQVDYSIQNLSLQQAFEFYQQGKSIWVDARHEIFYREAHIPGAINLSRISFEKDWNRLKDDTPFKDHQVIVYCSDKFCKDSQVVAQNLLAMGFTNIAVFKGGWEEWESSNFAQATN